MVANSKRAEAEGLFAFARRIISGTENVPAAPADPVDIRSGIDRAMRQSRRVSSTPTSIEEQSARAVATVEGTLVAIDSIHDYLCEALELTAEALSDPDLTKRAMIADRYAELRSRIDTVAAGATFEGANLIDSSRQAIEIKIPAAGQPRHAIGHITLIAGDTGLCLNVPAQNFADENEIEITRRTLLAARQRLDLAAETFLNQASILAPYLGVLPEEASTKSA